MYTYYYINIYYSKYLNCIKNTKKSDIFVQKEYLLITQMACFELQTSQV